MRSESSILVSHVNLDVLICIASHLDIESLSLLSQTNHFFYQFVEKYGWKSLCTKRRIKITRDFTVPLLHSTSPSFPFKYILQVGQAWETKCFRSYQTLLPLATLPNGKLERHPPQPLLLLTKLGLFLFTGIEMRLWSKAVLQCSDSIEMKQAQVFYLNNPAGFDKQSNSTGTGTRSSSSALWDICACTQLDSDGQYIAIGRLNGLLEVIHLSKSSKNGRQGRRQGRREGEWRVNLVWIWRDFTCSTSIQSLHASPSAGLLAVTAKNGNVILFRLSLKGNSMQSEMVQMIEKWNVGSRPWSVWVEKSAWLAIGTNGSEAIILFPLHEQSLKPGDPIRLSSGTSNSSTSVYALQSRVISGKLYLLAGCYDGVLRKYDVESALVLNSLDKPPGPLRQFRDRFDPSAIYCLSTGGQEVAVGTARHGVCKFFQIDDTSNRKDDDEGWSMFAVNPSHSPTYSLVGQFDRLFGVTNAVFWHIDLRPINTLASKPDRKQEAQQQQQQQQQQHQQHTMAYYRHGDMIIDRTRWPSLS